MKLFKDMSRIGVRPIKIPSGVTVTLQDRRVTAVGQKGSAAIDLPLEVTAVVIDDTVRFSADKSSRRAREQFGLQRQLVSNMITGVIQGYRKGLELVGMGYRVSLNGKTLVLNIGFTHPVEISAPEGISFQVEGTTKIAVFGIDKQLVGEVAARIRKSRPPEPYKGKGICYEGEVVRRKAGKAGKASKL